MNSILVNNKKAYFNYEIIDKVEAGIILEGWEVKAVKSHKISLESAYIKEIKNELYLVGARIAPLKFSPNISKDKQNRDKKLLLNKRQILKLTLETKKSGVTIVPLQIYTNLKNLIKVEIGLARGKRKFDKRAKLKEKDIQRRIKEDRKFYNF